VPLYVYAVTDAGRAAPDVPGVRGSLPRMVEHGRLSAAVSEIDAVARRLEEDDLWAHEDVVEALMEAGPVLPMRAGTVLAEGEAVESLLWEWSAQLVEALERVRGAVEFGIRAIIDPDDGSAVATAGGDPPTGSQYMLGRLATKRRGDELARRVHEPLATLARESAVNAGPDLGRQLRAAYLVDVERVDRFRDQVDELERDEVASALVCTGPWPPYSFSDLRPRT
jgi:Gas vesicle synthesis protein GvpL/GvpF